MVRTPAEIQGGKKRGLRAARVMAEYRIAHLPADNLDRDWGIFQVLEIVWLGSS
jgi:hypothetical protein